MYQLLVFCFGSSIDEEEEEEEEGDSGGNAGASCPAALWQMKLLTFSL